MKKRDNIMQLYRKAVFAILLGVYAYIVVAQNQAVLITDDTTHVASSMAMLELHAQYKGMLIPRMSYEQMLNISPVKDGLTVFVTGNDKMGFWHYDSAEDSEQLNPHGEWVKLRDAGDGPEPVIAPIDAIIMYSGPFTNFYMSGDTAGLGRPGTVMDGWMLCNGNNGTPDLSQKFIVGYEKDDIEYGEIGNTGGYDSIRLENTELPAHLHGGPTATASCAHTHNVIDYGHCHEIPIVQSATGDDQRVTSRNPNESGELYTDNAKIVFDEQTSTYSVGITLHFPLNFLTSEGGNDAGQTDKTDNRPKYYILAFIIRKDN